MKARRTTSASAPAPTDDQRVDGAGEAGNAAANDALGAMERAPDDVGVLESLIRALDDGEASFDDSGAAPDPVGAEGDGFAAGLVYPGLPPGFSRTIGLTTPSTAFVAPTLAITVEPRPGDGLEPTRWVATIAPTVARDAWHNAMATPVGVYPDGSVTLNTPTGPQSFTMELQIDEAGYASIRDAEQEHLDDLAYAYRITLGAAADAVNSLADSEFFAGSWAEARAQAVAAVNARLHPKLAVKQPEAAAGDWELALLRLFGRNPRDARGWHTAEADNGRASIDPKGRRIVRRIDPRSGEVGVHPSSEVVSLDDLP